MINNWFEERFNELDLIKDSLKKLEQGDAYICVSTGPADNWVESLKYSIEEDIGYVIWGQDLFTSPLPKDKNKKKDNEDENEEDEDFIFPPAMGYRVKESLKSIKESLKNIDERDSTHILEKLKPIFHILYVTGSGNKSNSGILGIGLMDDVEVSLLRKFKYWKEDNQAFISRWRVKVLWLNQSVLEELENRDKLNPDKWKLKSLEGRWLVNSCLKDTNNERKNYILEKLKDLKTLENDESLENCDSEACKTLKFYKKLRESGQVSSVTTNQVPQSVQLNCNNDSNAVDLSKIFLNINFFKENNSEQGMLQTILKSSAKNGNILLIGPPGTGKSTVAMRIAESFRNGNEGECYSLTTADSLWFRRDVIGGETIVNNTVKWRSGLLIKAYNEAARTNGYYFLIIDEINRADVDKAFGELFTVISSPDPNEWRIPDSLVKEIESYGKDRRDNEAETFLRNYYSLGDRPLKKIRIIATMNLTDTRYLFNLGNAMLRRFFAIMFDYPNGAEDVDFFFDDIFTNFHNNDKDKIKNDIKDYVKKLREGFRVKNNDENQGSLSKFNISPASVKMALRLYKSYLEAGRQHDINVFLHFLRSSLGTLSDIDLNKFDDIVRGKNGQKGQQKQNPL